MGLGVAERAVRRHPARRSGDVAAAGRDCQGSGRFGKLKALAQQIAGKPEEFVDKSIVARTYIPQVCRHVASGKDTKLTGLSSMFYAVSSTFLFLVTYACNTISMVVFRFCSRA